MSADQEKRLYVLRALAQLGSKAPSKYVEMLAGTPANMVIPGLSPWTFEREPETAIEFCSKALGRTVLPFAQAVEEDMLACFETEPSQDPAVVVINPWAQDEGEWVKGEVEIARLEHFDAWLAYAKRVAEAVQQRDAQE